VLLAGLWAGCGKSSTAPPLPALSAVSVTPEVDTLRIGEIGQFAAAAYDTLGNPATGVAFTWSSGNASVFTVNQVGRALGAGEGTAPLFVEAGGVRDTAWVTVFPDTGWFVQPSGAGVDLFGVFFQPDGQSGWTVGDGGKILHTADAGASWTTQVSSSGFTLHGVWFTDEREGWAVGVSGTVLRTTDRGATWIRLVNVGAGEILKDVVFASRDTGWVVGSNGAILRTFDRGTSWQRTNALTAFSLNSVAFSGTRDGWAVGDGGVIVGTHDRGLSWFLVPSLTTDVLEAVWRRSASLAFAAGSQGVVPRTESLPDSTTWVLHNAGGGLGLEGLCYPADQIGYAVGSNASLGATVLRTDDGGLTWEIQAAHTGAPLNDVFFVDALRGWAVGQGGTIIHTARGGRR
jgi:hypothetical protein